MKTNVMCKSETQGDSVPLIVAVKSPRQEVNPKSVYYCCGIKDAIKRNQVNAKLINLRTLKRKNVAKIKLFAGICKSDEFTLEQAYEDFAHIPLTTQLADN